MHILIILPLRLATTTACRAVIDIKKANDLTDTFSHTCLCVTSIFCVDGNNFKIKSQAVNRNLVCWLHIQSTNLSFLHIFNIN